MPLMLECALKPPMTVKDAPIGSFFKMLSGGWVNSIIYRCNGAMYVNLSSKDCYWMAPGEAFQAFQIEVLPDGTNLTIKN